MKKKIIKSIIKLGIDSFEDSWFEQDEFDEKDWEELKMHFDNAVKELELFAESREDK